MDRRQFFRHSIERLSRASVREVDRRAEKRAHGWIRPPYALDELEFLLACTRCKACIDACPHQVVFPLSARCGASVVGTPALDLLNHGCHLCRDWPCVGACETGALSRPDDPEDEQPIPKRPRLALARIDTSHCLPYKGPECGACWGSCPQPGGLRWDGPRPRIDSEHCVGCALCREACIAEPKAIVLEHLPAEDET